MPVKPLKKVTALDILEPGKSELPEDLSEYFGKCQSKLGFVPNVLRAHAFSIDKLRNFMTSYNHLMLGESELSKLEREMIAAVVSSLNRCWYCIVSHGQAVRELSGNPVLGEALVMNYRVAPISGKQRAMLDFCVKLTQQPAEIEEPDRARLRKVGFGDGAIWDIVATAAFYAMSNRMAIGVEMQPNPEYHALSR